MSQSAYTSYDQKIVTGTQVISAYQNFEGKPVAILIATQSTIDKYAEDGETEILKSNGVKEAYGDADGAVPLVKCTGSQQTDAKGNEVSDSDGTTAVFINYNALIGKGEENGSSGNFTRTMGTMKFDNNCWRTENGYVAYNGRVQYNNISGNLSKSGMMEYIPTGARFQAYLIKDVSGTTMGVTFEQVGSR